MWTGVRSGEQGKQARRNILPMIVETERKERIFRSNGGTLWVP